MLARTTQLRKYADFVFEMADWLAASQITAAEPALRIYDGAIDVKGTGRSGVATAVHVEGLVEAAMTAESFGDRERAARYRKVIRRALRFVLQLQFRTEECFYVQSPAEVVGGVRASPYEPSLRIDHTVHALAAIIGCRSVGAGSPQNPSTPLSGSNSCIWGVLSPSHYFAACLAVLGCSDSRDQPSASQKGEAAMQTATQTLSIRSKAFENNQPIPVKYTADGQDISPPLTWGMPYPPARGNWL